MLFMESRKLGLPVRVLGAAPPTFFFSAVSAPALPSVFFSIVVSTTALARVLVLEPAGALISFFAVVPSATLPSLFILTTGPRKGISIVVSDPPESVALSAYSGSGCLSFGFRWATPR
jgi:hypothetical protein